MVNAEISSWANNHNLLWLPKSHLIMVLCPISLSVITARPPCFTEDIPLLTSSLSNPGIVSQVVSSQIESNSNTTELGVLYSISQLRFHKKHPPNVGVMELLLVDHHHQDHDQQQEQSTTRSTGARSTGSWAPGLRGAGAPHTAAHILGRVGFRRLSAARVQLSSPSFTFYWTKVRFGKGLPKTGNLTKPTQEHYHTFGGFVLIVHDMQLKKKPNELTFLACHSI